MNRSSAAESASEEHGSDVRFLRQRIAALEARLCEAKRDRDNVAAVLNDVLGSASWRLTSPLRLAAKFCRQIFPLWRSRVAALEISSGRNVSESGGRFSIHGPSPALRVSVSQGHVPSGWVRIYGELGRETPAMFFFLHFSETEDFSQDKRVLLSLDAQRGGASVVCLPQGTKHLRLDPFVSQHDFSVARLEMRELGSAQVLLDLIRTRAGKIGADPAKWLALGRKAWAVLREGGLTALFNKLFSGQHSNDYQEWVAKYDTLTERDHDLMRRWIEKFRYRPLVSVVMPTFNTPPAFLRAAIESVRAQLYTNWELCIADDNSSDPEVRPILEEYARLDARIKVVFRSANGHIAACSNSALELASGEFVALLDHDDALREHALALVVHELNEFPQAGLVYSDEDKLNPAGVRFNPYFKPDWNPDLLLCQNFVCHLAVFRRDLVQAVGGFRTGVEGAQDWDLILRVGAKLREEQIRHIPHVLYHWRVIEGSTAQATINKPYVLEAQARVVHEHLERSGVRGAKVEIVHSLSQLRVKRACPSERPLVSIIIPTRDRVQLLEVCIESIRKHTTYENMEFLVVDNGSVEAETMTYFDKIKQYGNVRVIRDDLPFNFPRLNNRAAREARGALLAFLNNDLEVISPGWLTEMVSHAVRPEVGAVGARLLYPNGLIQHAGIILGIGGIAGHNHKGQPGHNPGYFNRAILTQNLSAVTAACMLMRRDVFDQTAGFDESLAVAFNDVDFCLRIRAKGYLIVYAPHAELYHHESASRGYEDTPEKFARFEREIQEMRKRWGAVLDKDPYYNPNLSILTEDFRFAFPPRIERPWIVAGSRSEIEGAGV